ncbi:MAG: hypothetical protein LBM77_04585 [Spirochaetaceae bacterium]|nr:hypothetical protein [Spirochaetaceae bacterium]
MNLKLQIRRVSGCVSRILKKQLFQRREGVTMRVKGDFSVFPRTLRTGKVVWYYQTYDENGERRGARSTGQSTKTMAVKYCNNLLRAGNLLPEKKAPPPTFAEYAADWWIRGKCKYLEKKLKRDRDRSPHYEKTKRRITEDYLIPQFGKKRLDKITDEEIDAWLTNMKAVGRKPKS